MKKFRVGDLVRANERATDVYVVTTEGWLGIVSEIRSEHMRVYSIFGKQENDYNVITEYFDLYETFPEDATT